MSFYRFVQVVVRAYLSLGYRIRVENAEKLPTDRGFILVANHCTYSDPLFIGLGFRRQVRFMAKEELFRKPVLKQIIMGLGSFPVSRGKGDQSAIIKAEEIVRGGGVLGIFPEGTRSKDGTLGRAKSGAVVVAAQTGGDVVPVGIRYGKKRFIRREVTIRYGDAIENSRLHISAELHKTELKEASKLIMDQISALLE